MWLLSIVLNFHGQILWNFILINTVTFQIRFEKTWSTWTHFHGSYCFLHIFLFLYTQMVGMADACYVSEVSYVDLKTNAMVIRSKNVSWSPLSFSKSYVYFLFQIFYISVAFSMSSCFMHVSILFTFLDVFLLCISC